MSAVDAVHVAAKAIARASRATLLATLTTAAQHGHRRGAVSGRPARLPRCPRYLRASTGEPAGIGRVGQAFVDAFSGQVSGRTVTTYGVNYPATYDFAMATDGANDASSYVTGFVQSCPSTASCSAAIHRAPQWSTCWPAYRRWATRSAKSVRRAAAGQPRPNVAAVAVFGNPATKFGNPVTSAVPVRRQGDRPVQGRRSDLLPRPEPVRSQRLRERRPDRSGRELCRGHCLARLGVTFLVPSNRIRRWLIAAATAALPPRRPFSPLRCRPCRLESPRPTTAPTSRWSSPAAPMSRRARKCRRRVRRRAAQQGRRQVGRHVRGELPRELRLPGSRRRGQRRQRPHPVHGRATARNTRLVLGGYSQGAAVIDVISAVPHPRRRHRFDNPLPPNVPDHVAAIAVFGNPSAKLGLPAHGEPGVGRQGHRPVQRRTTRSAIPTAENRCRTPRLRGRPTSTRRPTSWQLALARAELLTIAVPGISLGSDEVRIDLELRRWVRRGSSIWRRRSPRRAALIAPAALPGRPRCRPVGVRRLPGSRGRLRPRPFGVAGRRHPRQRLHQRAALEDRTRTSACTRCATPPTTRSTSAPTI